MGTQSSLQSPLQKKNFWPRCSKYTQKQKSKFFGLCLTLFNFLFCLKDFKQIVEILQELLPLEINKYKSLTC